MKKFVVMLLVALFTLGGGEKIFGEANSANARIVYDGAEMKDVHLNLLKGYLYEAVVKGDFDDEMKGKTAEMLVWATKLLVHKEVFDLTNGKDDLSRLFKAAVLDINDFFRNPKVSKQEKTIRSQGWIENGKKLIVRFTRITLKSRSTGKETTKIDWEIRLPAKVDKKK